MENKAKKEGFLLLDKPADITSHGVVYRLRKIAGIKKIGHAGTLDPFAGGLLIMAIGRSATKEISRFVKLEKAYEAHIRLGVRSSTHDPEGELVTATAPVVPTEEMVKKVLAQFVGEREQIPPMHSAKKIGGKKLYELARQGKGRAQSVRRKDLLA